MQLTGYYRSSTSYRVRIALNLKGLDYRQDFVDLAAGAHLADAFGAVNPFRSMPVLETGDDVLVQSMAIIDWLERHYPSPSFLPADPAAAEQCRMLYYAICSDIHAVNNLRVLQHLRSEFGADDAAIAAWNRKWIMQTLAPVERILQDMAWATDDLPFAVPGLFEIALIPQLYNARRWGIDVTQMPCIAKIEQACLALPAFIAASPEQQPDNPEKTL